MKIYNENNKYALSQVALLIIFSLGLILSGLIVSNRKRLILSEPIKMPAGGVSVSLPHGNGWQSTGKWMHNAVNNHLEIHSWLYDGQTRRRSVGVTKFHYLVAPEDISFKQALKESLKEMKIFKYQTGKIVQDGLDIELAEVTTENRMTDYYFGRCRLPSGRLLHIEVLTPGNPELASEVFSAIIKHLQYSPDERITAGEQFVERFKRSGVTAGLEKETSGTLRRTYLVSKFNKRLIRFEKGNGFLIENFRKYKDLNGTDIINANTLYFVDGDKGWSGSGLFESDDNLENFHIKTKTNALNGEPLRQSQLEYSKGALRQFNLIAAGRLWDGEKVSMPSDSAMPELFLDSMLRDYIDDGSDLVIDVIFSNGRIVPAVLTLIEPDKGLIKLDSADYAVRFEIIDGKDSVYEVYFNSEKQIISKVEKTDSEVYLLEKTEVPVLLQRFSSWRNDIERALE